MAFSIRNSEAEALARKMARERGVTITQVVKEALEEKARREPAGYRTGSVLNDILEIAERCASRETLDERSLEEILGYDEIGLFDGH